MTTPPTTPTPLQEKCQIGGKDVPPAEFEARLARLVVGSTPESSSSLVEPDGSFGGTEARYAARDPETGERYALTEVQIESHRFRALEERPGELLRWEVEQGLWGHETLVVLVDGTAHYTFTPVRPHERSPEDHVRALSSDERRALDEALATAPDPSITSRRLGIPDEAKPDLSVYRGGRRLRIVLWDGEWGEDPRASRYARAVARVIELLRGVRSRK